MNLEENLPLRLLLLGLVAILKARNVMTKSEILEIMEELGETKKAWYIQKNNRNL